MKTQLVNLLTLALIGPMMMGCDAKEASRFSILPAVDVYAQDGVYEPRKIDVLWIVDNSGSMQTSQQNLASNFASFIEKFKDLKFDFHIAVGSTDGWQSKFDRNSLLSNLRDGSDVNGHSGLYIINNLTPNIVQTFQTNAMLGVYPYAGDERAFQSFEAILTDPDNAGFRRDDAFLAIVILSDEDDFSSTDALFLNNNYSSPKLIPLDYYINFLDTYTGRTSADQPANYSVSAITVTDTACQTQLNKDYFLRVPGLRYMELAAATQGTVGSLCDSFADTLSSISDSIVNYSSVFPLTREPRPDTITVSINNAIVPSDEVNGWTYRSSDNTIWFHGTAIPPAGSKIRIDFDPVSIIK